VNVSAVTAVRRRVIWEQEGRRGRKADPAWDDRRRLLTGSHRLSDKAFSVMWNGLIDSDPSSQILTASIAKEELRSLLALARTGATRSVIAIGCTPSTPGAPKPTSMSSTPSRPPSTRGGPRSWHSSTPASPTPEPKASTASSNSPSDQPAATETHQRPPTNTPGLHPDPPGNSNLKNVARLNSKSPETTGSTVAFSLNDRGRSFSRTRASPTATRRTNGKINNTMTAPEHE
jgi:hypothetical protein